MLLVLMFWALVGVVMVAGWFGFEVRSGRFGLGSVLTVRTAVIMASAVSVIGLAIAVPRIIRANRLASEGIQVLGTIRQRLGVTRHSLDTVRISYTVNDQAYTIKAPRGRHDGAAGTKVQLIFDPKAPRRCMLREYVFPPGFDVNA